jgi:hypothetical protein
VLELIGIDQSPSHPLHEPSRKVVALQVAWDQPLLQYDDALAAICTICRYENLWHRGPPFLVGDTIVLRRPCRRLKAG